MGCACDQGKEMKTNAHVPHGRRRSAARCWPTRCEDVGSSHAEVFLELRTTTHRFLRSSSGDHTTERNESLMTLTVRGRLGHGTALDLHHIDTYPMGASYDDTSRSIRAQARCSSRRRLSQRPNMWMLAKPLQELTTFLVYVKIGSESND